MEYTFRDMKHFVLMNHQEVIAVGSSDLDEKEMHAMYSNDDTNLIILQEPIETLLDGTGQHNGYDIWSMKPNEVLMLLKSSSIQ